MDALTVGGRFDRWLIYPNKYPGSNTKKAGEMDGKAFQRGGRTASFFLAGSLGPPHMPLR
jgi:hypothetical protein